MTNHYERGTSKDSHCNLGSNVPYETENCSSYYGKQKGNLNEGAYVSNYMISFVQRMSGFFPE